MIEAHPLDAVSLFSGAAGLDYGIETAGRLLGDEFGPIKTRFRIRGYVEWDSVMQETLKLNMKSGALSQAEVYGDIAEIGNPRRIIEECGVAGELPLLCGGPPCQSFSTAGRRRTVQDPRGLLVWEFVRFVRDIRPQFFLIENVRGLISAALRHRPISERGERNPDLEDDEQPGSVLTTLLADLEKAGYHVDVFEVNAVNYGAPQLRERVLLVGNKYNLTLDFPHPTYGAGGTLLKPWRTLGDALSGLRDSDPEMLDFSERKKKYLAMIPQGGNWRSMPEATQKESMGSAWYAKGGRSGWWRRLSFDLPSPCLVTMPNHAGTALCHPTAVRALSLREYLRIQEFPDNWAVAGTTAEKYKQVGNAVPVRLGEVAGKVIGDALVGLGDVREVKAGQPVVPSRKVYISSHIRTRKWFENGQAVVRQVARAPIMPGGSA